MPISQQRNGNVIFFAGASTGDALAELARALMDPFVPHAKNVILIEVSRASWVKELTDLLTEPVWFAASHFGVGQDLHVTIDGVPKNVWEHYRIPFVRFYGDLPAYFPDRHNAQFQNGINAYSNPEQHDFYRRWFKRRCLSINFPPIPIDPIEAASIDVETKKRGRIVFPKNGNSPIQLQAYWRTALPDSIANALQSIGEDLIAAETIDQDPKIDDRLVSWYANGGVDIEANPSLLCFLVAQLDDYLRRVKSTMIAESVLDLPVVIRGRNWEHVNFSGRRATYDPCFGMAETLGLIDQAPAILDMAPNTQLHPHDRIWRAVGRHTAFLTNNQRFLTESLGQIAERCCFEFEPKTIHAMVEHFVDHPADAVDLGFLLANRLASYFDPANYVATLIAAIDAVSLNCGPRPHGTQEYVEFPPVTAMDS